MDVDLHYCSHSTMTTLTETISTQMVYMCNERYGTAHAKKRGKKRGGMVDRKRGEVM